MSPSLQAARCTPGTRSHLRLEPLEPRLLLDAAMWAVDIDGFWDTPENWSTGVVPGYNDDVIIDRAGADVTVTVRDARSLQEITCTETLSVSIGANLLVYAESTIDGTLVLDGGTLTAYAAITASGATTWAAGTIAGAWGFTNTGTMTLTGADDKFLQAVMTNDGTLVHDGDGSLLIGGSCYLVNNGLYDLQGDGGIGRSDIGGGAFPRVTNAGTLRKSGGAGTSVIGGGYFTFDHVADTIEVQTGTLRFDGALGANTGATFDVADGATLDLIGGEVATHTGTYTGTGEGTVALSGTFTTGAGGATFDFPEGLLEWRSGTVNGGATGLTNLDTITLTGADDKFLQGAMTNDGTIVHEGDGSLLIGGSSSLVNNSLYDLQTDAGIGRSDIGGGAFPRVTNAGTLRKSGGAGTSVIGGGYFTFDHVADTIEVQTGTLRFDGALGANTGATFDVADGATLDLIGGQVATHTGTYTGTGEGTVALSGTFTTGAGGATFDFPEGLLEWRSGTVNGGATGLTNLDTITLTGADDKFLQGAMTNDGTIVHEGAGSLLIGGGSYLVNNSLYDLQTDAGIGRSGIGGGAHPRVTNAGTLRKSGGAGTSVIGGGYFTFDHVADTIEVQTGTLRFDGALGSNTDATFDVADGATLDLICGQAATHTGIYAGAGEGSVVLSGYFTTGTGGATLDFPEGMLEWTGGTLYAGASGLTNAGTITLAGADGKSLHGTLLNDGTIIHGGSGDLDFTGGGAGSTLENPADALYDFAGDGGITGYGNFNNAGAVSKSGGIGESRIGVSFNNLEALIEVQAGTLTLAYGGASTGGTFNVETGAALQIGEFGSNWFMDATGTYTGTGDGIVDFVGRFRGDTDYPPVLDFPEGLFQWTTGQFWGNVDNAGFITLSGGVAKFVRGMLSNSGTMIHSGDGNLELYVTTLFDNGGLYDLQSDADLVLIGVPYTGPGIDNWGTFRKSGGTGVSETTDPGGIGQLTFHNYGVVDVQTGTFSFGEPVDNVTGDTLTGGTWLVADGATLVIPSAAAIAVNRADVRLTGPGSVFTNIDALAINEGSFAIRDGRDFATVGNLANSGTLTVGSGSTLTVNGDFSETGTETLHIEIAGQPVSGLFGQVAVTGQADLQGALAIDFVEGDVPEQGDSYTVLTYAGHTGEFAAIRGLGAGRASLLEAVVGDLDVRLNSLVDAADLDVTDITVPPTGLLGNDLAFSYTVENISDNDVTATSWTDSVYLSLDDEFDPWDILLTRVQHTGAVVAHDTYTENVTATVHDVLPGDYYLVVVADSRGYVPDPNRESNKQASDDPIAIDIEHLTLGAPTAGSLAKGQSVYYAVDVDAGENLLIEFDSDAPDGISELYVSWEKLPTRSTYEYRPERGFRPDQQLVIPDTVAGTYYLLAFAADYEPQTAHDYTVQADYVPFALTSVDLGTVGNAGSVTFFAEGIRFNDETTFQLIDDASTPFDATRVQIIDSTQVLVTFNLAGAAEGLADIAAARDGDTSTLTDATTIEAGSPGELEVDLRAQSRVRIGRINRWLVHYENIGKTDIDIPVLLFSLPGATYLGTDPFGENLGDSVMILGLPDMPLHPSLRPGEGATIPFYGILEENSRGILKAFDLDDPVLDEPVLDYDAIYESAYPSQAWQDYVDAMHADFGDTWADLFNAAIAEIDDIMAVDVGYETVRHINGLWDFELGDTGAVQFRTVPDARGGETGFPIAVYTSAAAAGVTPGEPPGAAALSDPLLDPNGHSLTYVVIITDQDYVKRSGYDGLYGCSKDRQIAYDYFKNEQGIPDSRILRLHDGVGDGFKMDPTAFYAKIDELNGVVDGNDKVVFHYSGHGNAYKDTKQPFLALHDGDISPQGLATRLDDLGAGDYQVVLDACSSGDFGPDLATASQRNMTVYTGGTDGQKVADGGSDGGLFSRNFYKMAGEKGSLDNGFDAAQKAVVDYSKGNDKLAAFNEAWNAYQQALIEHPGDAAVAVAHANRVRRTLRYGWQRPARFGPGQPGGGDDDFLPPKKLIDEAEEQEKKLKEEVAEPPEGNIPRGGTDWEDTEALQSWDPNDITGPAGYGPDGFVPADLEFGYLIRFENLAAATAPAQEVLITQQLDADLDYTTFAFGDIGFGETFVDVPDGRTFYATRVDLTDTAGLYVDLTADFDVATGLATWTFMAIDPDTGDLPMDPLAGFLTPNVTSPEGEGYVYYSVTPQAGLPSGTRIDAQATIVFDVNPPIDTPAIYHTLDAGGPTSAVQTLPATSNAEALVVDWGGQDDAGGSGVAFYDVYVSEDGGAYETWFLATQQTQATYPAYPGRSYAFYSVATDNVGHAEAAPAGADTATDTLAFTHDLTPGKGTSKWSFTGANGETVTVALKGKAGTVELLRAVPDDQPGNIYVLTANATDAKSSIVVTTKGGETSILDILVHGDLKALTAKTTDLGGDLTVDGWLGKGQLDDVADGHAISIGGSPDHKPVTLVFDQMTDVVLDCASPLKAINASEWLQGLGRADTIECLSLAKLIIKGRKANAKKGLTALAGDFQADIILTGAGVAAGKPALGSVKVAGEIACTWTITGSIGTVKAASFADTWTLAATGSVKTLDGRNALGGTASALSFGTVKTKGDFTAALTATGADAKGVAIAKVQADKATAAALAAANGSIRQVKLNAWDGGTLATTRLEKLLVKNWLDSVAIRCTEWLGTATLGGVRHSTLFAGVEPAVTGLPDEAADFDDQAHGCINKLTIKGIKGETHCVVNTNIAAWEVRNVLIREVQMDNAPHGGLDFGIHGIEVAKVTWQQGRERYRFLAGAAPEWPAAPGNFVVGEV